MLVVTHDRWFLDAVCTATWEVADGAIHQYEGGYAAYVLARAERDRQAAARNDRRQQLLRKELAWLRRGPPARTSKPKFRIEAANALIADEPEPRDRAELLRFAGARLGDKVLEAEDVSVAFGDKRVLRGVTWRLGPRRPRRARRRQRLGQVDAAGAAGRRARSPPPARCSAARPCASRISRRTRRRSPATSTCSSRWRRSRACATLSDGVQITAALLCDRFGFRGEKARTLARDLSGGERRRLQLMRLLMGEPNVLLLDEPTNDLDIDTLTALEDLLDGWPGTLVVVSHDRYFVERVCDDVHALTPDGELRHLPRGIEQYLEARRAARPDTANGPKAAPTPAASKPAAPAGAVLRAARKEVARLERAIEKLAAREAALADEMAGAATDHVRLRELQSELQATVAEREAREAEWMHVAEQLEA